MRIEEKGIRSCAFQWYQGLKAQTGITALRILNGK